jgi:hypothetical protein
MLRKVSDRARAIVTSADHRAVTVRDMAVSVAGMIAEFCTPGRRADEGLVNHYLT